MTPLPPASRLCRTPLPERSLDVLRALAVLFVLFDHALACYGIPTFFTLSGYRIGLGHTGVLIFFVHTSLVLMSSLERHGQRPAWVKDFYIRRAFRIYPLAIVSMILCMILKVPLHAAPAGQPNEFPALTVKTIVSNLTLTQNLVGVPLVSGVIWSLPLEVQMYVLLPLCFLFAKKGIRWVVGLIGVSLVAYWMVGHIPILWRLTLANYAPVFLLGILTYAIFRRYPPSWDLPESRVTRAAKTVAKYSYGIYLLHPVAIWFSFGVAYFYAHGSPLVQWTLLGIGVVLLPWLAYTYIEAPMIGVGVRLTSPSRDRQTLKTPLFTGFQGAQ